MKKRQMSEVHTFNRLVIIKFPNDCVQLKVENLIDLYFSFLN